MEFCYSRELCLQRGDHRLSHPTLRPGSGVIWKDLTRAIAFLACNQPGEMFLACVFSDCCHGHAAVFELVLKLGRLLPCHTFPRAQHLMDLPAATSNDVTASVVTLQGDTLLMISDFSQNLQFCSVQEGFGAVVKVSCHAAAFELVLKLGGTLPFHKFPRTEHLVDLGAASSDDLVATSSSAGSLEGDIAVEEKVDGGCMGFSLASDLSILIQNRSRYITPKTHAQFAKLGVWVESHRQQLFDLLYRDEQLPERFMLFGEWLAATHAIHYTALSDLFLAFDLYDRLKDEFMSRSVLSALLSGTGIQQVPLMTELSGSISIADLVAMTDHQSAFRDGPVEGVYVRIQRDGKTLLRGKIVRANFTPGNSDWDKHTTMNELCAMPDP